MPMTGKAIFGGAGGPPFRELLTLGFGTEIIYSLVIIVCSLMIYLGTKELYELSSHKGIKYFRQAFLFFAIAYFFRSFIKFILSYFKLGMILDMPQRTFGLFVGQLTLFGFMYFSSMAIFYLLYSVMWKKWNGDNSKKIYLFHGLAFIISVVIILTGNPLIYLTVNVLLFLVVLFVVYISYDSRKKKPKSSQRQNLYVIYLLLLFFWILNIMDILIPDFFQTFQLFIYVASITVFLMMLYKVIKKTGAN